MSLTLEDIVRGVCSRNPEYTDKEILVESKAISSIINIIKAKEPNMSDDELEDFANSIYNAVKKSDMQDIRDKSPKSSNEELSLDDAYTRSEGLVVSQNLENSEPARTYISEEINKLTSNFKSSNVKSKIDKLVSEYGINIRYCITHNPVASEQEILEWAEQEVTRAKQHIERKDITISSNTVIKLVNKLQSCNLKKSAAPPWTLNNDGKNIAKRFSNDFIMDIYDIINLIPMLFNVSAFENMTDEPNAYELCALLVDVCNTVIKDNGDGSNLQKLKDAYIRYGKMVAVKLINKSTIIDTCLPCVVEDILDAFCVIREALHDDTILANYTDYNVHVIGVNRTVVSKPKSDKDITSYVNELLQKEEDDMSLINRK